MFVFPEVLASNKRYDDTPMVTTSSGISNTTLENVEENAPVVQTPVVESMKPEDVDGTISKDKAIALAKKELVERYGYDKKIEKIAAVEFIKVNSPVNPYKWTIIFGDLDLLKPHEENFLNPSTGEMEKIPYICYCEGMQRKKWKKLKK